MRQAFFTAALLAMTATTALAQKQNTGACCAKDSASACAASCNTTHSKAFIYAAEEPWTDTEPGVQRQVMGYNGNVMVAKVRFKKGAKGLPHRHYQTQTTYVASGMFEFNIGGVTKIVSAGDALYMAPDVEHGCTALTDGLLIDCFSPMRESFLKADK